MAQQAFGQEARGERLSIRATGQQRQLLEQAAEAAGKTLTAFVLDASSVEAQRMLADRRVFVLDEASWEQFDAALQRPAVDKPQLRELLETPSVLEQGTLKR